MADGLCVACGALAGRWRGNPGECREEAERKTTGEQKCIPRCSGSRPCQALDVVPCGALVACRNDAQRIANPWKSFVNQRLSSGWCGFWCGWRPQGARKEPAQAPPTGGHSLPDHYKRPLRFFGQKCPGYSSSSLLRVAVTTSKYINTCWKPLGADFS